MPDLKSERMGFAFFQGRETAVPDGTGRRPSIAQATNRPACRLWGQIEARPQRGASTRTLNLAQRETQRLPGGCEVVGSRRGRR